MRRIAATLTVVGALLFSAGATLADDTGEANKLFLEAVYGAADTDGDRQIDLEEIKTYLDRTMTRRARRDFLREQEAWISGAPDTVLVQLGSQQ